MRRALEKTFRPVADVVQPEYRGSHQTLGESKGFHPDPANTIRHAIDSGAPLCVGRVGRTELQVAQKVRSRKLGGLWWQLIDSLASGDPHFYFFKSRRLLEGAGLSPLSQAVEERFHEMTSAALEQVDILASWVPGEAWFAKELEHSIAVPLETLEPYRLEAPWSQSLAGKRVLVVHPFEESIQRQFSAHGDRLFGGRGVLPEFSLSTLRPPQAYFGEIHSPDTWFKKLEELIGEVEARTFDIALIGAGPFGLPLASEIKKGGRQAIVIGGATQLLFGIMGGRWDNDPVIQSLHNDLWVRPLATEIPPTAKKIEKSAYW